MGGYGSGRNGFSTTAKVDEGLRLDINKLVRDGLVKTDTHRQGTLYWTNTHSGEKVGSIGYELKTDCTNDMWIRLYYTHTMHSDEAEEIDYKIKLETTQPNYGGRRLWFLCPFTNKRASVLYSPSGSKWFASRHAFNLNYQSQSKSAHDRAIDRMWKLKNRLGGDDYWCKPKGMHKAKHERMMEEIWDAEGVCGSYFTKFVMKGFAPPKDLFVV